MDTTPPSAIVDDLLALSYEGACVVHNANTCQAPVAFDANTDHFAVERDIFSGAAKDEMRQRYSKKWCSRGLGNLNLVLCFSKHHFSQRRDGLAILYLGDFEIDVVVVTAWLMSFRW